MKNIIQQFSVTLLIVLGFSVILDAATGRRAMEKVTIKTSAICKSCKTRIESAVKKIEGVESANLNLDSKKLSVKFDNSKTSAGIIRSVVSNTGYKADEVMPDKTAFNKLPKCCQTEGLCKE